MRAKTNKGLQFVSGPHLKALRSTQIFLWGFLSALLPVCVAAVLFFRWDALRILFMAVGTGLFLEWLFHFKTPQKAKTWIPSTLLLTSLFALLLPQATPSWLVALGTFVVMFLAYEAFGGLGQNLFHPALVGYLTLAGLFPIEMTQSAALCSGSVLAVAIGGGMAVAAKWIRWDVVLIYFVSGGICSYAFGTVPEFFNAHLLFCAVFILTDTTTSPVTRKGRMLFAAGAGILTASFQFWTGNAQAIASAILLMNGIAPLLDRYGKLNIRTINYG